jgi:segregation and condensation protein B
MIQDPLGFKNPKGLMRRNFLTSMAKLYHSMSDSTFPSPQAPSADLPQGSQLETHASNSPEIAPGLIPGLLGYLEALLFVAPGEVNASQLAIALDLPLSEIERGLSELETLYTQEGPSRGLRLQRFRGRVQLTTAPDTAPYIERFLGLESSSRLSRAALETLAIILYRQPVTHPQIDSIRGVNSDGVLKSLLLKGLVQEVGRAEAPGRPILYSATAECLQYFGLSSLSELPALDLEEAPPPG